LARQQQEVVALQKQATAALKIQDVAARGLAQNQQQSGRQDIGGWQYTRWGMSPREVVLASKGAFPLIADSLGKGKKGLVVGNVGSYYAGTRHCSAKFYYAESGLYDVTLEPKNSKECENLKADLTGVYGQPSNKLDNFWLSAYDWIDAANNNAITLSEFGGNCSLVYRPLRAVGL
jgi:hypothetical protein